jgi:hypothetical protein
MASYYSSQTQLGIKLWYVNNQTGAPLNVRLFVGTTSAPASMSVTAGIGTSSNSVPSPLSLVVGIYSSAAVSSMLPLATCAVGLGSSGFTVKATKVKALNGTITYALTKV